LKSAYVVATINAIILFSSENIQRHCFLWRGNIGPNVISCCAMERGTQLVMTQWRLGRKISCYFSCYRKVTEIKFLSAN